MPEKPILCLDFDGVIHRYSKGWQDGAIYDPPTDGLQAWVGEAAKHFRLVVYSSRSKDKGGTEAMVAWMRKHDLPVDLFDFAHEKPPAYLTIDDRAITFMGDWGQLTPKALLAFRTWQTL